MKPQGSAPLVRGLSFVILALMGCGSDTDNLPRQAISGMVSLDGKPLEAGSITFDPEDPNQPNAVSGYSPIEEGSYSIPKASGLTPGNYRVSISATDADAAPPATSEAPGPPSKSTPKKPSIPAKYNTKSTLKAEVKPGGTDPIDFPLKSR